MISASASNKVNPIGNRNNQIIDNKIPIANPLNNHTHDNQGKKNFIENYDDINNNNRKTNKALRDDHLHRSYDNRRQGYDIGRMYQTNYGKPINVNNLKLLKEDHQYRQYDDNRGQGRDTGRMFQTSYGNGAPPCRPADLNNLNNDLIKYNDNNNAVPSYLSDITEEDLFEEDCNEDSSSSGNKIKKGGKSKKRKS
jgi:hypothetical protein